MRFLDIRIFLVGGWTTHVKNISQNGNLPQVGMKIKNIWNHHPVMCLKIPHQKLSHSGPLAILQGYFSCQTASNPWVIFRGTISLQTPPISRRNPSCNLYPNLDLARLHSQTWPRKCWRFRPNLARSAWQLPGLRRAKCVARCHEVLEVSTSHSHKQKG